LLSQLLLNIGCSVAAAACCTDLAKSPFRQDLLKEASQDTEKLQQQQDNNGSGSSSAASFSNFAGSGSGSFTSADASSLRELLK
jgi:hypothetical protein